MMSARHVGAAVLVTGLLGIAAATNACVIFRCEPSDPQPKATISGAVRGPNNAAAANDREILAIDVRTGERYTTRTNDVGDYTFLVPAGTYRLEFPLRAGERLRHQPEALKLRPADIKGEVNLVVERTD
jgi:hypothetical protein